MTTALTTDPKTTALATANAHGLQAVTLEGGDSADLIIPRAQLFQDTATERNQFGGDYKLGDLVDALERRKIASTRFVPISAWKSWAKWEEEQERPVYSTRDREAVPVEDLEWNGETPPAATEMLNYLVVFEGEATPHLLVFKRTGINAGKQLNTFETLRAKTRRMPGLYEVTWTQATGAKKSVYARIGVRPAGDPPQELLDVVAMFASAYSDAAKVDEAIDRADGASDLEEPTGF